MGIEYQWYVIQISVSEWGEDCKPIRPEAKPVRYGTLEELNTYLDGLRPHAQWVYQKKDVMQALNIYDEEMPFAYLKIKEDLYTLWVAKMNSLF